MGIQRYLFILVSLTWVAVLIPAEDPAGVRVFNKVKPAIVVVKSEAGQGSGVILPSGRIVTNFHVVEKAKAILVGYGKKFFPARVYVANAEKDLCLLDAPDLKASSATIGSAFKIKVGATVYAVGAPRGMELSISNGIVSQLRGGTPPIIQTTAAISPGSSGGGLFDVQGNLVGVTTFKLKNAENINFALPVEWVEDLERSKTQPTVERSLNAWMTYQVEMDQEWEGLKIFIRDRRASINEKLEALHKLESTWSEENPHSTRDNEIHSWISSQIAQLRIRQSRAASREAKKSLNAESFAVWRTQEFKDLEPILNKTEIGKAYLKWLETGVGSPAVSPGELLTEELSGIILVGLPAGTFTMGSTGNTDEKPPHPVTISHAFYMGETEVTQGQWKAVMGYNPSKFQGDDNRPVESVSWDEAQAFISRINQQVNDLIFRLPTEAEWEYACRAGTTGDYYGDLEVVCWYSKNSPSTRPVGQKQPNRFGLFDMHGNVWEWCEDWYARNYMVGNPTIDPSGPTAGDRRVIRGGSWYTERDFCRSSYRDRNAPGNRDSSLGLRIVAVPTKAPTR